MCRLGKDWNRGVQRGIQMALKEGHMKQICQNVKVRFEKTGLWLQWCSL